MFLRFCGRMLMIRGFFRSFVSSALCILVRCGDNWMMSRVSDVSERCKRHAVKRSEVLDVTSEPVGACTFVNARRGAADRGFGASKGCVGIVQDTWLLELAPWLSRVD